ncbi:hypothetical protein T06_263 [Trichinella sp. T6]|nr:hypothetical protein T06_263 [Trichinella sp. T6]
MPGTRMHLFLFHVRLLELPIIDVPDAISELCEITEIPKKNFCFIYIHIKKIKRELIELVSTYQERNINKRRFFEGRRAHINNDITVAQMKISKHHLNNVEEKPPPTGTDKDDSIFCLTKHA